MRQLLTFSAIISLATAGLFAATATNSIDTILTDTDTDFALVNTSGLETLAQNKGGELKTYYLSGKEVKEHLGQSISGGNTVVATTNFHAVVNTKQPGGHIVASTVGNQPLKDNHIYTVVSNFEIKGGTPLKTHDAHQQSHWAKQSLLTTHRLNNIERNNGKFRR